MTPDTLLDAFALPLLTGGSARLALPMTDDLFDAVCAQTPPQMPALADALTIESRLIWATAPAAQVNADIVYTAAMLHDLLGAMHPVFTRSSVARMVGKRIDARVAGRRRALTTPAQALYRHVLTTAALRLVRVDEHVDLRGVGRITGYGEAADYLPLPWRIEDARHTTQLSAVEVLTPARLAVLERLSPLTAFVIAAQNGRPLPWIRWLTGVPALLRFVVHTLSTTPNGPEALVHTLPTVQFRRAVDVRWWLGLTLLVGCRTRHGDGHFREVVDAIRPYATELGAPAMRARQRGVRVDSVLAAARQAGLEG